jgi:hypothetical protein
MCAGTGQTPVIDDQILIADRAAVERLVLEAAEGVTAV